MTTEVGRLADRSRDQLAPIFETFKDCARYAEEDAKAVDGYLNARHRKRALWCHRLGDSNNQFAKKAFTALIRKDKKLLDDQRPLLEILHVAALDTRTTDERHNAVHALVKDLRAVTKKLLAEEAATLVNANVLDLLYTVETARIKLGTASRLVPDLRAEKNRLSLSMCDFLKMYASWIEEFKVPESAYHFQSGKYVLGENLLAKAVRTKKHKTWKPEVITFCRHLTSLFERQYGARMPSVVANLANAVFASVPEVSTDNVKAMTPGLDERPPHKVRRPRQQENGG